MWEINGISEQDPCGYMYIVGTVSSKKKTMPGTDIYFILSIKRVLDSDELHHLL